MEKEQTIYPGGNKMEDKKENSDNGFESKFKKEEWFLKLADDKKNLILKAEKEYGEISPCIHKKNLGECFTNTEGRTIFWFNSSDGSTHALD